MGGAYGTCKWEGLMEHVSGRSLWNMYEGGACGTRRWEELMRGRSIRNM